MLVAVGQFFALQSAFFALLVAPVGAYKILVYSPSIAPSHLMLNARVADVLAQDGHHVVSELSKFEIGKIKRIISLAKVCFFGV